MILTLSVISYAAQEQPMTETGFTSDTETELAADAADAHLLEYLLGDETDAEGKQFWGVGEEDTEYALYDLNDDGQNELIYRMYGYWIPDIIEYRDNAIVFANVSNVGSAGVTFINTKNQFVSGDTTHASREQYWISEIDEQGEGKTVLYFSKMWDDWAQQEGQTDYYVCENPEQDDFSTDDCRKISEAEYEDLLEEYTQEQQIDWMKAAAISF